MTRPSRHAAATCVSAALLLGGAAAIAGATPGRAEEEALANPVLGEAAAIAAGERLYRSRCVGCHGASGGRGPNLFATDLSDEQFLMTAINGRKGTQMPAFGLRLSPDDIWAIHAYVTSRDEAF